MTTFDPVALREQFPTLQRPARNGGRLVFLDSGASSQTPDSVLAAMAGYYERSRSNVHRGVYQLAEEATDLYEGARRKVASFLNADERGVVFTKNATEATNIVAYSFVRRFLGPGDAVLVTEMEHHANFVPYQYACTDLGIEFRVVPVTGEGLLDLEAFAELIADGKVKFFGVTHASNVLGTINDVAALSAQAKAANPDCVVLADTCQSVPHMSVDFRALDVDAIVFSGHKMLGPTGIGALVAKPELLEKMPPFLAGGEMIREVSIARTTWNDIPHKFEAGTPMIAEAAGLTAAIEALETLGMDAIRQHEIELTGHFLAALGEIDGVTVHGPQDPQHRGGTLSFAVDGVHPHDIGAMLDQFGVCIRVGHHCAKPLMRCLGVGSTARASLYVYNDVDDIPPLVDGIRKAQTFFAR